MNTSIFEVLSNFKEKNFLLKNFEIQDNVMVDLFQLKVARFEKTGSKVIFYCAWKAENYNPFSKRRFS